MTEPYLLARACIKQIHFRDPFVWARWCSDATNKKPSLHLRITFGPLPSPALLSSRCVHGQSMLLDLLERTSPLNAPPPPTAVQINDCLERFFGLCLCMRTFLMTTPQKHTHSPTTAAIHNFFHLVGKIFINTNLHLKAWSFAVFKCSCWKATTCHSGIWPKWKMLPDFVL